MDKPFIEEAADILLEARKNHKLLDLLTDNWKPDNATDAYEIQDHLAGIVDSPVFGWKVGATNAKSQEMLGANAPFGGRMFDALTFNSPAEIPFNNFFAPGIEVEMAFRISKDLVAGNSHSLEDVRGAVDAMYGAIEIIDSRFAIGVKAGIEHVIADNGAHGAFVLGQEIKNWESVSRLDIPVRLVINGDEFSSGVSSNATGGDPLESIVWLANNLSERGLTIASGEIITTGSCCAAVAWPKHGDTIRAEVADAVSIEIDFG